MNEEAALLAVRSMSNEVQLRFRLSSEYGIYGADAPGELVGVPNVIAYAQAGSCDSEELLSVLGWIRVLHNWLLAGVTPEEPEAEATTCFFLGSLRGDAEIAFAKDTVATAVSQLRPFDAAKAATTRPEGATESDLLHLWASALAEYFKVTAEASRAAPPVASVAKCSRPQRSDATREENGAADDAPLDARGTDQAESAASSAALAGDAIHAEGEPSPSSAEQNATATVLLPAPAVEAPVPQRAKAARPSQAAAEAAPEGPPPAPCHDTGGEADDARAVPFAHPPSPQPDADVAPAPAQQDAASPCQRPDMDPPEEPDSQLQRAKAARRTPAPEATTSAVVASVTPVDATSSNTEQEAAAKQKAEDEAQKVRAASKAAQKQAADEAAAAKKKAEDEAKKLRTEAEAAQKQAADEAAAAKKKAEEEAQKLRTEAEAAQKQAADEAATTKKKAEDEAKKLRTEAEAAKKKIEADLQKATIDALTLTKAAEAEAAAIRKKAEVEAGVVKADLDVTVKKTHAELVKMKAEVEKLRLEATAAKAAAADAAAALKKKIDAETAKAVLNADAAKKASEAEIAAARKKAEAEAAAMKKRAEQEVVNLKAAEQEAVRRKAEALTQHAAQSADAMFGAYFGGPLRAARPTHRTDDAGEGRAEEASQAPPEEGPRAKAAAPSGAGSANDVTPPVAAVVADQSPGEPPAVESPERSLSPDEKTSRYQAVAAAASRKKGEALKKYRKEHPGQPFIVHVASCSGLMCRDVFGGKSDPYVVAKSSVDTKTELLRTPVADGNSDPSWPQNTASFVIKLDPVGDKDTWLSFEVWDKDVGPSDDFLGCVRIPALTVISDTGARHYPLALREQETDAAVLKNARALGTITLKFAPRTEAAAAPPVVAASTKASRRDPAASVDADVVPVQPRAKAAAPAAAPVERVLDYSTGEPAHVTAVVIGDISSPLRHRRALASMASAVGQQTPSTDQSMLRESRLPPTLHLSAGTRNTFIAICNEILMNASKVNVIVIDVVACAELLWGDDLCAQKLLTVVEGCPKVRHVIWPASGRVSATGGYYTVIELALLRHVAAAKLAEAEATLLRHSATGGLVTLYLADVGLGDEDLDTIHALLRKYTPRGVALDLSRNAFTPAVGSRLQRLVDDDTCGIVSLTVDSCDCSAADVLEYVHSRAATRLGKYLRGS